MWTGPRPWCEMHSKHLALSKLATGKLATVPPTPLHFADMHVIHSMCWWMMDDV